MLDGAGFRHSARVCSWMPCCCDVWQCHVYSCISSQGPVHISYGHIPCEGYISKSQPRVEAQAGRV